MSLLLQLSLQVQGQPVDSISFSLIQRGKTILPSNTDWKVEALDDNGKDILIDNSELNSLFPFVFLHDTPTMNANYTLRVAHGKDSMELRMELYFVGLEGMRMRIEFQPGKHTFRVLDIPFEHRKKTMFVNSDGKKERSCKLRKKKKSMN